MSTRILTDAEVIDLPMVNIRQTAFPVRMSLVVLLVVDYFAPYDFRMGGFGLLRQLDEGFELQIFGDNFSKAEREYKRLEGIGQN